jgi:subtilase family serine protease
MLAVAASAAATAGAAQAASPPGPNTPEKVPTGLLASALPGASAFGDTPSSTPEQVSFILKERGISQLESSVTSGLSSFDSVSQFAGKYGQTSAVVNALTSYLAKFGITTTVYPGNVDVSASGTAGEFDQALTIKQMNYHVPAQHGINGHRIPAQTVYSTTGAPELPYGISQYVLAVLGLTNYAPFDSNAVHLNETTKTTPASSSADAPGSFLPADFAANYGLAPLYKKANGSGETIGIVTLAALDVGAPEYFWQNVAKVPATGRTVTVDNVDGGPGAPSDAAGTGETDLDVEQSGGLAPGANVIVYQAPNSDTGFIDGFFSAASQNTADTVSTSWGESETLVGAAVAAGQETVAYEAAFDEAFLELADQGQSIFASAGDAGAYDASGDLGSTNLSVDTPADSPYITSAGGTTLPWSGTITGSAGSASVTVKSQRAWGWDYLWPAIASTTGRTFTDAAKAFVVGGGGGFSTVEPEPSYQRLVSGTSNFHGEQYLTPTAVRAVVPGTDFVEPTDWNVTQTPATVSGGGAGRAEPDLSADADPQSGYLLYEPSFVPTGQPALQPGWGGTSFVSPQFNGSTAVIDSYLGHRIGLWNPSLYSFARGSASPVTPLSQASSDNDNVFYTGNPGELYNPATGLGVPNLARFAGDLAKQ